MSFLQEKLVFCPARTSYDSYNDIMVKPTLEDPSLVNCHLPEEVNILLFLSTWGYMQERGFIKRIKIVFFQFHLSVSTAEHGMTFWLNCPPGKFYNLCPVTQLAYQTNNKTLSQGQDWSACHAFTKGFVLLLDYWYSVSYWKNSSLTEQFWYWKWGGVVSKNTLLFSSYHQNW